MVRRCGFLFGFLICLLFAGIAYGQNFPCWYEVNRDGIAEVKFVGKTIMRLRTRDPQERARQFVEKINLLWRKGFLFRDFQIVGIKSDHVIKYGDEEILRVSEEEAKANNTTTFHLAAVWLNNLCDGMAMLQSYRLWSRNTSYPRVMEGIASWYGSEWNNRRTASGEIYWDRKLVAASKTLPFNSLVKVTDLKTGRWVIVRIVDRGPYV
ncbi:MAG: hypothetical protein H5T91_08130, partial [Synergistetes bacterium]|nr:hypothetical protein [Synergistota bacterium]